MRHVPYALLLCGSLLLATSCSVVTPATPPKGGSDFRVATTPTPCPTPSPSEDCRVTGGGWIEYTCPVDPKVTFGFNADENGGDPKGEVEVVDHGTGYNFHGTVTGVTCCVLSTDTKKNQTSVRYTITGTLDQQSTGYPGTFRLIVTDFGEPGNTNSGKGNDTFNFTITSGALTGYNRQGTLAGGNIQAHEFENIPCNCDP